MDTAQAASQTDTTSPMVDWKSLIIKILLMILTPVAAQLHLDLGASSLYAIATDLADLIVLGYGIYRSSGMKLVPHHTIVVDPIITAANVHEATATVQTASGPVAGKIVPAILLAVLIPIAMAWPGDANAAQRAPAAASQGPVFTGDLPADVKNGFKGDPSTGVQLTGNLKKDAEALWTKIQAAALPDLQYSSAMAGAAGTNGGNVRKQCWDAIIVVNQQSNGAGLKNADGSPMVKPDPHFFTDVETAAEILDNLSPQGKLFTSCAGAAQLAQANVIQFISAAITGAAGIAKLAPIPGL